MGERMSRVEDRMTSVEVEVKRVQDGQRELIESFRRLEALVSVAHQDSSTPQPSSSAAAHVPSTATKSRDGDPECSVLLFFPFECKKAFMKIHIQRVFEEMPEKFTHSAVLTLPPAGKTGGLKFPTSDEAHAFADYMRDHPYAFVDKDTGEPRKVGCDVAKSVPRKVRGKVFAPVYAALLEAGFKKDDIIQRHTNDDIFPETVLFLGGKDDRVHKAGVFHFQLTGSRGRIIRFDPDQMVKDSPTLARLIDKAAGITVTSSGSS